MRYIPPFGVSDPDASYVNGDPTIGRQGSIPSAAVFENPQREIISVITNSNIVPSDADLEQLARAVRSQRLNYVEDQGAPNNIIVSMNPPLGAYTRGLVLRVRMRNTNTSSVSINAGPGNAPVRKMNGADVGSGELSAGGIVTMVYDGAVFQLSNFMAGGGATEVINVRIPYTVDASLTPNTIIADFLPALSPNEMVAGMMVAVKIAHTNTGPTQMRINGMPAVQLRANGSSTTPSGLTLQGDIKRDDVVLFFYDGQFLWFAPNPEISDFISYDIGDGGQFPTVEAALDEIRRKTVGANGYVEFVLRRGTYGPIKFSHPNADRMRIRGTLNFGVPGSGGGVTVNWTELQRSGASAAALNSDYSFNSALLQARYGTVIRPLNTHPDGTDSAALEQAGPGTLAVMDLLFLGERRLTTHTRNWQIGILLTGTNVHCANVAFCGCNTGLYTEAGIATLNNCTFANCVDHGILNRGNISMTNSALVGASRGTIPSYSYGIASYQTTFCGACRTLNNDRGVYAIGGRCDLYAVTTINNFEWDALAIDGGAIAFVSGNRGWPIEESTWNRVSPPINTQGNVGAVMIFRRTNDPILF